MIEYKRFLELKSVDISNSRSQFDKLVEQYKKSASKDLLNQLYQKEETVQEKNAKNKENTQESKWKAKGISEEIKQNDKGDNFNNYFNLHDCLSICLMCLCHTFEFPNLI